uniref:Uncharacterized protein n=1 Tax=Solanum tuberosum TaxID=4113 RepID=M1CWY1_SOLTU
MPSAYLFMSFIQQPCWRQPLGVVPHIERILASVIISVGDVVKYQLKDAFQVVFNFLLLVLFTGFRQDLQKLSGFRIFSSQAGAMWRHDDWGRGRKCAILSPDAK